jgi:hypothetical protein
MLIARQNLHNRRRSPPVREIAAGEPKPSRSPKIGVVSVCLKIPMKPAAQCYFVRPEDVTPYHPANHTGPVNRRLIGPDNVGASNVEVLLGIIDSGEGALTHAHPGVEQVC